MDVQMPTVPTASSTGSTVTGKAAATQADSKNSFNQVLDGQVVQAPVKDVANPADPATSLSMLMQMLQSLVMPLQGVTIQPTDQGAVDQTLPEMLVTAMNSNPSLADKLLQDPKVKQWLENAEQLLNTIAGQQTTSVFPNSDALKLKSTDSLNLQAQNTLLTLASLSKQQPDNPILNYLNQDLQQSIQTLLPELLDALKSPIPSNDSVAGTAAAASVSGKKEAVVPDQSSHLKRISKLGTEPKIEASTFSFVQATKSKFEVLAVKNVLFAPLLASTNQSEPTMVSLVDLPTTESEPVQNPVMTISDLQKTQLASLPVDKAAPVLSAANFTEEMTEHVLKNMKITLADGISEAKLSLFPKNLGQVDVRISMHDGQLIAQFAADTLAGKQMLESQLPQLRQALQTQGLQVEKL
ncbi:flagellar hook-length control protein FliK, partial [Paenibacillus sp. N3.4]|uniref:flagellar hook-length control protein FliK n=1 Tax=Paenibacillus sp. N3.4 TaxID=2603222 RepID=UPI0011C6FA94